jgi:hypothetical protein
MNKLNTTFIITGGAGRVINSIPALEKYERLNPNDDFKVIVHGWEQLFWSHPTLQKRVFGAHQKGLFDQIIKNSRVVSPEPYQLHRFFNQKCNIIEAFDECINNTQEHDDLNYNCLHLSDFETHKIRDLVTRFKEERKKRKLIVFQPYGSAVEAIDKQPIDRSNRSLKLHDYFEIVKAINNDSVIVYTSQPQFRHPNDKYSISIDEYQPYLRTMMGLISECDYFVGVCSVGQHMARSFNKPGLILMGATSEQNFSYPEHFDIYRKKNRQPYYTPWRLSESDCEFSDRENNGIMDFSKEELQEIINKIKSNIDGSSRLDQSETSTLTAKYD